MQLSKNELIKALIKGLKLDDNIFNYRTVSEEVEKIKESNFMEFYKKVMGENNYGNGIQVIIKITEQFKKTTKVDLFLKDSKSVAKEMYDKFYSESSAMSSFTTSNRDRYPNDLLFFSTFSYAQAKKVDDSMAYTKKEIYVLRELGGGEWLMNIKLNENSKTVIDKIQRIIIDGIETKYSKDEILTNPKVAKIIKV